ncbi:MAG: histidinol-phosphate transaminase [Myxococcota bacterium]
MTGPTPIAALAEMGGYSPKRSLIHTPHRLDGNEGRPPPAALLSAVQEAGVECVRSYPNKRPLEALIAERHSVPADCILVTNGADDALDRIARAFVGPGRTLLAPGPTFEMIERYVRIAGGRYVEVPWWEDALPMSSLRAAVDATVSVITVVSPNNPTGLTASLEEIEELVSAYPNRLVVVDLAYAEFADADLTVPLLAHRNVVMTRTLSKAWSLAGARVGYAMASNPELIRYLRDAGGPFPVSGLSLAVAEAWMNLGREHVEDSRATVIAERESIFDRLGRLGERPFPSQANYVTSRFRDVQWVADCLASLGIAIRVYVDKPKLSHCARITCPQDPSLLTRLLDGLQSSLAPAGLLVERGALDADSLSCLRAVMPVDVAAEPQTASDRWWVGVNPAHFASARDHRMISFAMGTDNQTAQRHNAARGFGSAEDVRAALEKRTLA